jgi:hypothetical protein
MRSGPRELDGFHLERRGAQNLKSVTSANGRFGCAPW